MMGRRTVTNIQLSIAAGLLLGLLFTASPLTVVTLALMVPVVALAGRGLPSSERRVLTALLVAALALRAAAIGALVTIGIPEHNDLAIGSLTGDDAYYLSRAIRTRDVLAGFAGGKYDYFVIHDEYGRTSYLGLLTALQVVFGPTPFSMRLLNAVVFVAGAVLFFRMARRAFGSLPAMTGLALLLFLPSLLWSSISLLKESAYFLCSAMVAYCALALTRRPAAGRTVACLAALAVLIWLLDDLRRGAVVLTVSGLALGVLIRVAAVTSTRLAVVSAAVVVAATVALSEPSIRVRAVTAIEGVARVHGGHVFTAGHAYKLLDEGFYKNPSAPAAWPLELTGAQAARFVVRAAVAFVTLPFPWQMRSLGEAAYLVDQLVWYLMIVGLPFGLVAGWQRERWTVSLLLGLAIPMAAAVALTNGNVGTLMRLRGLVTPYLLWIGTLGVIAIANAMAAAPRTARGTLTDRPLEGSA